MIVVVNSTPLIHLSKIGRLSLLKDFFKEIYIPYAVYQEVIVNGAGRKDAFAVSNADWIKERNVEPKYLSKLTETVLDPGERETIALSLQLDASLTVMDEL